MTTINPSAPAWADVRLQVDGSEFDEGACVPVTLEGTAGVDLSILGGEVQLARTVTFLYRKGNIYGSFYTSPARSIEVVDRHLVPSGGRL